MIESIDQMNQEVILSQFPIRIVSLVPSQTELLADLGLKNEVVGITKFCIHPNDWSRTKVKIGGTKKCNIEKIKELQPDLIIGNKEENTREDIELLKTIAPVWMSDVNTLEQAIHMVEELGRITNRNQEGQKISKEIQHNFANLELQCQSKSWTCLYFMWKDPYFTVGTNTFINDMIKMCGGVNLQDSERYPEWDFSVDVHPDVVLLSSEPYPFNQTHVPFFEEKYPESKIRLVDGEYFSWYGSRLIKAPGYFEKVINEIRNS